MAAGLLVYDALYAILALALYGGAGTAGVELAARLAAHLPLAVAALVGGGAGLVTLVAEVGVLTAMLPRLEAGRYPLMKGRVFYAWLFRAMLRRILYLPPLKTLLYTSNVLRWAHLRALGAKVAFTANMSSDVDLIDPALLRVEAGAMIGARALVTGHYVADGHLVLAPVTIGPGALVSGDVALAPGVTVGARAVIHARASVSRGVTIGDGATVGPLAYIEAGAVIPPDTRVPAFTAHHRDPAN